MLQKCCPTPGSRFTAIKSSKHFVKHSCTNLRSTKAQAWYEDGFQHKGQSFDDGEVISFISSDSIVSFPSHPLARSNIPKRKKIEKMPTWEEQGLCIGASFHVAATNGYNPARRLYYLGFCQSVDYLFESIEHLVFLKGGEVLWEERDLKGGVHEVLKVTVFIPMLWGVPPQSDALSFAIKEGGGIVDKVYYQWMMT